MTENISARKFHEVRNSAFMPPRPTWGRYVRPRKIPPPNQPVIANNLGRKPLAVLPRSGRISQGIHRPQLGAPAEPEQPHHRFGGHWLDRPLLAEAHMYTCIHKGLVKYFAHYPPNEIGPCHGTSNMQLRRNEILSLSQLATTSPRTSHWK